MAVASAGPYATLHLAQDRLPRQHLTTQFFYRPDALPAVKALKEFSGGTQCKEITEIKIY